MTVDIEKVSNTKRIYKIEVPADVVSKEVSEAYNNLRKKVKVPGFRPGKTPLNLIERRYGKDVEADLIRKLVPDYYLQAIKENGVTPVEMPLFENIDIKKGGPLTFTATVEIKPKIEGVVYEGIELKKEEDAEVTEEDIDKGIEDLREYHAQLEVCEDGHPVEEGDYVQINYAGFSDDKPVQGLKGDGVMFQIGSGAIAPEIDKALTGALRGEETEINIPERNLLFKTKILEVKMKILPEINDDLARDAGGHNSLAELREKVKEEIKEHRRESQQSNYKKELIKKLIELNPVEPPPALIEREMQGLLARTKGYMGKKDEFEEKEEKAFREKFKTYAEEQVKGELLVTALAEIEEISAAPEEVEEEIGRLAANSQQDVWRVKQSIESMDGGLDRLRNKIIEEKTIRLIMDKVKWS